MRILFLCLLCSLQHIAISQGDNWLPYRTENGKWSFVKQTGEKMVAEFDSVIRFWEVPFAKIQNNGKWGMIKFDGDTIVPIKFDVVNFERIYPTGGEPNRTNFIRTEIHNGKKNFIGLYNEFGKKILDPVFEDIHVYRNIGSQPVLYTEKNCNHVDCPNGRYEIYKADGTFLSRGLLTNEELFELDGTYFIRISRKDRWDRDEYGLINEFGDTVISLNRSRIYEGSDPFRIAVIGRNYFTSAGFGEWINGKIIVRNEAIASDGSVIYRLEWEPNDKNSTGVHFVNAQGKLIGKGETIYSKPIYLGKGQGALLKTTEGDIVVDSLGNVLNKYPSYLLTYNNRYGNSYIDFQDSSGKWGLMDIRGRILLPPIFDTYFDTYYHLDTFTNTIHGRPVSIDQNTWEIIRFGEYDSLSYRKRYSEFPSYFISTRENRIGLFSSAGDLLIPHQWSRINPSYSEERKEFSFEAISENKFAVYSINGQLLKEYNWKKGTYARINGDYYLIQTKRKQKVVNIHTDTELFKLNSSVDRAFVNEHFGENFNESTDLEIDFKDPLMFHYFDRKKGSLLLDSTGRILVRTRKKEFSIIHGIYHDKKLIGSMVYYGDVSTGYYSPEIKFINGVTLDSSYRLSRINYQWYSDSSDFIEFHSSLDTQVVFFTPEGKFVAKYVENQATYRPIRIFKNDLGVNLYKEDLKPLLPAYFDQIYKRDEIFIGQRNGKKCFIYLGEHPNTSIWYDQIETYSRYYLAYSGDTFALFDYDGNPILDGGLSHNHYTGFSEFVTVDSSYWIQNGEIYTVTKR